MVVAYLLAKARCSLSQDTELIAWQHMGMAATHTITRSTEKGRVAVDVMDCHTVTTLLFFHAVTGVCQHSDV